MKQFTSVNDIENLNMLLSEAISLKENEFAHKELGKNKTLGLVFMNPSLRTRMSTQKAAKNLGMEVIVLNISEEGWKLEMEDGVVMNGDTIEHIKDAASVMGLYCDIIGLRCFPTLKSKDTDYSEKILNQFMRYSNCPFISLESATLHPLQSLADSITIKENWSKKTKPKVVLTWAPHVKVLPQAVPNSFAEWMCKNENIDFVISNPPGYNLSEKFTAGATVTHNQEEALKNADFVYIKNWSSYSEYGTLPMVATDWLLTKEKLSTTNHAKIMHCLPARRNVEISDELIDGPHSIVLQQAKNRVYAAQIILKKMLESNF